MTKHVPDEIVRDVRCGSVIQVLDLLRGSMTPEEVVQALPKLEPAFDMLTNYVVHGKMSGQEIKETGTVIAMRQQLSSVVVDCSGARPSLVPGGLLLQPDLTR